MKKFFAVLTTLLAITVAGGLTAPVLSPRAAETDENSVTIGVDDLGLLLPGTYEQYLPLSANVSSLSVAGKYIAVADGDAIHVYDGTGYHTYTHAEGEITQLELMENASGYTLFFQDKFTDLYQYDCNALEEIETAPHAAFQQGSAFTISPAGDLYFSRITESLGTIYVNNASDENRFETFSGKTTMYYADGYVYYTTNGNRLEKRSERGSETEILDRYSLAQTSVTDIVVVGSTLFYTAEGDLYTYDLESRIQGKKYDDYTYSAICTDGSYLYALAVPGTGSQEKTKIRRMSVRSEEFSDYEIGTSSAAENRAISAGRSIVNNDRLIVADYNRLTIYDRKTGTYSRITTDFTPDFIASNGKNILVAKQSVSASEAIVYDFDGNRVARTDGFIGGIVGATCVRESDYYLITSSNVCYKIEGDTFKKTQTSSRQLLVTATDLSGDVYGNLYVEYSDKNVYKYTESEFLEGGLGEIVYKFPSVVTSLAVDFDGNVYGASGDSIYCSDGKVYRVDSGDLLYRAGTKISSFAFGYESNLLYVVFPDHIFTTESVDIPNINNLAAGTAYHDIFLAEKELSVVSVSRGALLIDFSLAALGEESVVFPDCSYSRADESVQAIVMDDDLTIGKKEYLVVGIFNADKRSYSTKLVLKEYCAALSRDDFLNAPEGFKDGNGYLTNNVYLYKYPYLDSVVATIRLDKNSKLTVIGSLALNEQTDFPFYYVCVKTESGVSYGYVPGTFIRNADTVAQQPSIVNYNPDAITSTDALRYLVIALLVILDIGIAVNYLYIRIRN